MERIQLHSAQQIQNVHTPVKQTPAQAQNQFADMLGNALNQVNEAQVKSDHAAEKLANGQADDLHNVMIAAEKATITLRTAVEFRNKAVEAYQRIMRMQI